MVGTKNVYYNEMATKIQGPGGKISVVAQSIIMQIRIRDPKNVHSDPEGVSFKIKR